MQINDQTIWNDGFYVELFENLGVQIDRITNDTNYVLIQDGGASIEYDISYDMPATENEGPIRILLLENDTKEILEDIHFSL